MAKLVNSFHFDTTELRDTWLKRTFPDRKAQRMPGFYKAKSPRASVWVFMNTVTVTAGHDEMPGGGVELSS